MRLQAQAIAPHATRCSSIRAKCYAKKIAPALAFDRQVSAFAFRFVRRLRVLASITCSKWRFA